MVEPTKDSASVVLKNAAIDVIMPLRGIENAKLVSVPAGFVKLIVLSTIDSPGAEFPNPRNPGVPIKPPAIVVSDIGIPEANGMIALDPAGPIGPVSPTGPVAPVAPTAPAAPVAYC